MKRHFHFTGNRGQAIPMSLMLIPFLILLIHQTIRFSRFIERKIVLQNGVDAAILSGAAYLAHGLNEISRLNQKLIRCHQLLMLVKSGKVMTSAAGFILTEKILEKKIESIARKQELIKSIYPVGATGKVYAIAGKNGSPHISLAPFFFRYSIDRRPMVNGLPGPYELNSQFYQTNRWRIKGSAYRGAYRACAKAALSGDNLMMPRWRGVLSE